MGDGIDRQAAFILLRYLQPTWLMRRVESIEFVGENRVRRRVTFDIDLSSLPPEQRVSYALVPLALFRKRPLVAFDLVDQEGHPIPFMTRAENEDLAVRVLVSLATAVLGQPPTPETVQLLRAIVAQPSEEARRRFQDFATAVPGETDTLMIDPAFVRLTAALVENYLVLVSLATVYETRTIVKFCYDDSFPLSASRRSLFRWIGSKPDRFAFGLGDPLQVGSLHLEVRTPDGLHACRAELQARDLDGNLHRIAAAGQRPFVHFYWRRPPRIREAVAFVEFLPASRGLLRQSLGVATLILSLLLLGVVFPNDLASVMKGRAEGTTILLTSAGFVSTAVGIRGEHRLISRLLFGIRMLTVVCGAVAYFAALLVLASPAPEVATLLWRELTAVVLLCWSALLVAFTRATIEEGKVKE